MGICCTFPGIGNALACFCLFLFHLCNKKPPIVNKIPPNKDPTIAPIITDLLLDCCEPDGDGEPDGDDDDGGDGGDGSNISVHIYSSLLLMSSNKTSLSVD